MMASVRVDVWSDPVCPWCYIGKRRFERALAEFAHRDQVTIVHRSFQLNPAFPRGQVSPRRAAIMLKYRLSEQQAQEMDDKMEATAAAEGLEVHMSGGGTRKTVDAPPLLHPPRERRGPGGRAGGLFPPVF